MEKKKTKQHKIEPHQPTAEATDPEQKVGWTWTDPEGRTAGHTTRWIRQRMTARSSRDKSINKQARPRGEAIEAGGGGNRQHSSMVEKRQQDKERKGR